MAYPTHAEVCIKFATHAQRFWTSTFGHLPTQHIPPANMADLSRADWDTTAKLAFEDAAVAFEAEFVDVRRTVDTDRMYITIWTMADYALNLVHKPEKPQDATGRAIVRLTYGYRSAILPKPLHEKAKKSAPCRNNRNTFMPYKNAHPTSYFYAIGCNSCATTLNISVLGTMLKTLTGNG